MDLRQRRRSGVGRTVSFCVLVILLIGVEARAQDARKRVLLLYDEDTSLPGLGMIDDSLRSTFSAGLEDIEFFTESMTYSKFNNEQYEQLLSEFYSKKYRDKKLDLIVAVMGPALSFILRHADATFPGVPVIFCGADAANIQDIALPPNVTGLLLRRVFADTLDVALQLQPETRHVVVVGGTSTFDRHLQEQARREFERFEQRVSFRYLTELSKDDLLTEVSRLPPYTIVLYITLFRDGAGQAYIPHEVISWISNAANAPVYVFVDQYVGRGAVGGHVYRTDRLGENTAQIGLRILRGERPSTIPVQAVTSTSNMFDARELARWHLDERRLPADSIVGFRDTSLWGRYKEYIIGGAALIVAQTMLITGLLMQLKRRRRAELEREHFAALAETERRHLAEVISNLPGIVWEGHRDPVTKELKTTFVSDYLQKMIGYTPEEWLKQPSNPEFQIMLEDDREKVMRAVEAVMTSGKDGFTEFRWAAKDDRIVWVESYLSPIIGDNGRVEGVRGVTLDVSGRKKTEEALRATEEKSSAIVAAIPDLIFLQTADGVFVDYHAENKADLPAPPEELLGKNMSEVLPPELAADFERNFQFASEKHGPQILEYTLGEKWFEARIIRTGDKFLSVVRDITARKMADEAIRESEARFRNMADTAPVMIWISGTDKLYTYFNKQWLDFTGRRMEKELGNGWAEGVHPDDYKVWRESYATSFDNRKSIRLEYRLRRADGAYRWVFDIGSPRFSQTGEFLGYIGSCVDITDRREAESALHHANVELSKLKNQLEAENIYLQEELRQDAAFDSIIGQSAAIKYVVYKVSQVATIDSTVLILGETGTGKELVARAIHGASLRKDRPLIKVNCAALSPTLIESELFGHEKGAFTGAATRKMGRFELANSGTLLLDEIGELPMDLQGKLLRVLQEGEFERVGSGTTIKVDVRIIASTNRNLKLEVERGRFREDLWYRLNVFPITTPPLRDRRDDIPALTEHFARNFARKFGKRITEVSPNTIAELCRYGWPGNIRELANVIERAVINSPGPVLEVREDFPKLEAEVLAASVKTLEQMERDYIIRVLEDLRWRIEGPSGAARVLGINPSTLRTRMGKLGIQKPTEKSSPAPR